MTQVRKMDGAGAAVQGSHEEYQMAVDRAVQRVAHALQVRIAFDPHGLS